MMVGLALALTGWMEIQDILGDDEVDEGTKRRAETNVYVASAGLAALFVGLAWAIVGAVLLALTREPKAPAAGGARRAAGR
jgi:hypothetical protein